MDTAWLVSRILALTRSLTTTSRKLLPPPSREDLVKLQATLERIQLTLNSPAVLGNPGAESVRLWLKELKECAHSTEDVLEEYAYEIARAQVHRIILMDDLGAKLKDVLGRFIQISEESIALINWMAAGIGGSEIPKMTRFHSDTRNLPVMVSSPISEESSIFGRAQDKENVIQLLFDPNESDVVSVLAMVGKGGIGKSTLARLVYDDAQICQGFECRAWVNLSEEFCIESTTRNVLQSFLKKKPILVNFDGIRRKLVKELTGKSFFIVLDGVWDMQISQWDKFLEPLQYAQSGIIVITTRNISVSQTVATLPTFHTPCLSDSDCWSIFESIAFHNMDVKNNITMSETGRAIVQKCQNVPLAVKAIASTLKFELSEEKWLNILKCEVWNLRNNVDRDYVPFKICYECMSIEMQQCFLFLTLYPKGYAFSKNEIIGLWLSVGLLEQQNPESLHVGSLFLDELIQRSMIQPFPGEGDGGGFLMHNSMHEFARSFADEDITIAKSNSLDKLPPHVRYLSIINSQFPEPLDLTPLLNYRTLRVLQVINQWNQYAVPQIMIPNELFKYLLHLRSLILRDSQMEALPDSVGNLKLLRYLDVTNTCIESLPSSICNLYNLEVLELTNCPLKELPEGTQNLINLQILNFQNQFCLCLPAGISKLTSLRTLPRVDVRSDNWHCKLNELKGLVNISGGLYIGGLDCLTSVREAEEADLQSKRNLESLTLDWSREHFPGCSHRQDIGSVSEVTNNEKTAVSGLELDEMVLESLRPHTNLRELHIYQYVGTRLSTWMGSVSFVKLVNVSLVGGGRSYCRVLPMILGGLPSLKNLSVQSFPRVNIVRHELCIDLAAAKCFRSLEMLEFADMPEWFDWSGVENGECGALCTIRLVDCPMLNAIPVPLCSFLTEIVIKDCRKLAQLSKCPSLRSLAVSGEVSEELFSDLDLPLLRAFKICHSSIRSLYLITAKLPLVEKLIIKGCRRLESIAGIRGLGSLNTFKIFDCEKLKLSVNQLLPTTLRYVSISNCPKLEAWKMCLESKYNAQETCAEADASLATEPNPDPLVDRDLQMLSSEMSNQIPTTANQTTQEVSRQEKSTSEAQTQFLENPTLERPNTILSCPRCNSLDTQFRYFNNYNINQPRHFCKSCLRYWTEGGILRNVRIPRDVIYVGNRSKLKVPNSSRTREGRVTQHQDQTHDNSSSSFRGKPELEESSGMQIREGLEHLSGTGYPKRSISKSIKDLTQAADVTDRSGDT